MSLFICLNFLSIKSINDRWICWLPLACIFNVCKNIIMEVRELIQGSPEIMFHSVTFSNVEFSLDFDIIYCIKQVVAYQGMTNIAQYLMLWIKMEWVDQRRIWDDALDCQLFLLPPHSFIDLSSLFLEAEQVFWPWRWPNPFRYEFLCLKAEKQFTWKLFPLKQRTLLLFKLFS